MGMMEVDKRRLAVADKDNNVGPCLECSICLEAASEPVVMLWGHLYCWRCMFRWLNSRNHGSVRCPVCKATVSEDHLVPLYGRGRPAMATTSRPRRPPPVRNVEQHRRLQELGMDMDYYQSWDSSAECLLGGIALAVLLPRQQRRAASRLQQILVFLAMVALLCFLLL